MPKQIRLNAFDMNCVAHQSPGLWAHPRDRADRYNTFDYLVELARILERGKFDALFLADVLGIYDVYRGSPDAAIANAVHVLYRHAQRCLGGSDMGTEAIESGQQSRTRVPGCARTRSEYIIAMLRAQRDHGRSPDADAAQVVARCFSHHEEAHLVMIDQVDLVDRHHHLLNAKNTQ